MDKALHERYQKITSLRNDMYEILGGFHNVRLVEYTHKRPQELKLYLYDGKNVDWRSPKLCEFVALKLIRGVKIKENKCFIEFQNHIEAKGGFECLKVER